MSVSQNVLLRNRKPRALPLYPSRRSSKRRRQTRSWLIRFALRKRHRPDRRESLIHASNGHTFLSLGTIPSFDDQRVRLSTELRGLLVSLRWLRHIHKPRAVFCLSDETAAVLMGEEGCPENLRDVLDKTQRACNDFSGSIKIERAQGGATL